MSNDRQNTMTKLILRNDLKRHRYSLSLNQFIILKVIVSQIIGYWISSLSDIVILSLFDLHINSSYFLQKELIPCVIGHNSTIGILDNTDRSNKTIHLLSSINNLMRREYIVFQKIKEVLYLRLDLIRHYIGIAPLSS